MWLGQSEQGGARAGARAERTWEATSAFTMRKGAPEGLRQRNDLHCSMLALAAALRVNCGSVQGRNRDTSWEPTKIIQGRHNDSDSTTKLLTVGAMRQSPPISREEEALQTPKPPPRGAAPTRLSPTVILDLLASPPSSLQTKVQRQQNLSHFEPW